MNSMQCLAEILHNISTGNKWLMPYLELSEKGETSFLGNSILRLYLSVLDARTHK